MELSRFIPILVLVHQALVRPCGCNKGRHHSSLSIRAEVPVIGRLRPRSILVHCAHTVLLDIIQGLLQNLVSRTFVATLRIVLNGKRTKDQATI